MNTYSWSAALALLCFALLLTWCGWLMWSNRRDAHAAREAAKRDRLHDIATIGFASAFFRGWIDEKGNVIERVGDWEDLH